MPVPPAPAPEPPVAARTTADWDSWDDDEPEPEQPIEPARIVQPSAMAAIRESGAVRLGGSAMEDALNAELHCSSCGTGKVWRFPRSRWDAGTDYYHVRNFAPDSRMPARLQADLAKLCVRLVADESAAAYACGCSWQTIDDTKTLDPLGGTAAAPHGGARLEGNLHWACP